MPSVLEKTYTEFIIKKDVASFIKLFSVITWEKIGFVRRQRGLKFHEVTVTQNLLFQFRLLSLAHPKSVKMFEAIDETANGNDIELYIKTSRGYIFFPCQAKIANKEKELYKSIDHLVISKKKGTSEQQIESLIKYASTKHKKIKGIPIYLFYNYSDNHHVRSEIASLAKDDIEVYGCTYMDATKLVGTYFVGSGWAKSPKPSFPELHPHLAKPFYTLFTSVNKPVKDWRPSDIANTDISELVFDRLPEEIDSNSWIPVTEDTINEPRIYKNRNTKSVNDNGETGFNPKYKIVLNDSEIDTSLMKWLFM